MVSLAVKTDLNLVWNETPTVHQSLRIFAACTGHLTVFFRSSVSNKIYPGEVQSATKTEMSTRDKTLK